MTHENGIYFGMPFEEYEKIERLSKSGIKRILISPADFWFESPLNPNPPRLTPEQERRLQKARLLGRAYHCARLEPDAFPERFCRMISQADFADQDGFLATGSAIESALAEKGEPKKSKDDADGVLSQARRLAATGYEGPIWHIELAKFEAERGERIAIEADDFDQILVDMARLASVPDAHAALSNGAAEVSILYDCPETGLPMKARLDYLRGDGWVEFKSFANSSGKPVEQCLLDAIRYNRYYIDAAAYDEAIEQIRTGDIAPRGEHGEAEAAMIEQIKSQSMPLPNRLIFQQKGGIPNVLSRSLALYEVPPASVLARSGAPSQEDIEHGDAATVRPTMLHAKAKAEIRRAKVAFERYCEIYPRGEPWLPWEPHAELNDFDFSPYWLEGRP